MRSVIWVMAVFLAACGVQQGEVASGTLYESGPIEAGMTAPDLVEIKSSDFVLLPCGSDFDPGQCVMISAGGKKILIGAPASAAESLSQQDLKQLDLVVLTSLRGADTEGLDSIRNRSWLAGRKNPLRVVGPEGAAIVVELMNTMFEDADALAYVEQGAVGGFDAAVLVPVKADGEVFNTGDLVLFAEEELSGHVRVFVRYESWVAEIIPCGFDNETAPSEVTFVLECAADTGRWPLREPTFINQ